MRVQLIVIFFSCVHATPLRRPLVESQDSHYYGHSSQNHKRSRLYSPDSLGDPYEDQNASELGSQRSDQILRLPRRVPAKLGGERRIPDGEPEQQNEDSDPTTKELLDLARQHAIQVIVEKMLMAFGPEFIEESKGAPDNNTFPTVASPLNITTEPCPEIYSKCSSEIFLSSCTPPKNSHEGLWKQRFNLYFDLPDNLLKEEELLSATLRIYKHISLPFASPTTLIVELYSYTRSLTLKRDWNILINLTRVESDFLGWVSLDLTDLTRNLQSKRNHGFLIKVRDVNGILWNAPEIFLPMNCSDKNKILPVPFGVMIEEPEHRFPSLTIYTGMLYHYYSELRYGNDHSDYNSAAEVEDSKVTQQGDSHQRDDYPDMVNDRMRSDDHSASPNQMDSSSQEIVEANSEEVGLNSDRRDLWGHHHDVMRKRSYPALKWKRKND